ncbi:tripartite tricarboxylate transporter TctB family protein [Aeromicrobium duanguangcaii]|uniref:Tripartite tricarboxylate transporter TctB family protein n=1 Tax=Aeromicrobium duanguangcaii TaxID=2968086 RepID=A0ABY5KN38_9ACTN|nr:tripartite tricarboxylate transporter TctB family protein [Aeromicrobium duanguangcaii]MCD9153141.1 tripartite tricarboxylate transporter TctB family protein [Aeromicrobium duanguangcaii]UUI69758.1 tripartite tricarboxylate transporter TctB family protein [Aeromicrobium duanguangcaii]
MSNPVVDLNDGDAGPAALGAVTRGRRLISLTMIAAGLLYTVASLQLDRGELAQPGPGLFPLLVGVLAILAGGGGFWELRRGHVGSDGEAMSSGRKPWIFLVAMTLGVLSLPTLGYFVSALVCGMAVSWSAGQTKVWKALLTGLGIAVVSTFVFVRVLDVYLPSSFVDSWF